MRPRGRRWELPTRSAIDPPKIKKAHWVKVCVSETAPSNALALMSLDGWESAHKEVLAIRTKRTVRVILKGRSECSIMRPDSMESWAGGEENLFRKFVWP